MRKKKVNIDFTLPAIISDFSQDKENEKFSRAKLKVFNDAETEDHRYFTPSFRKHVIKTLPYTPIVSYYDPEKHDFVGHASEQQIYGIVDPCKEITFEKDDDGKEWCVCGIVLYTERPDTVGEIASKIVGHKHSLELDPNSVEYEILYDEKKHIKRIDFLKGDFVGLAVLGENQAPAFKGSEFFTYDEKFEEKMKFLKNYCIEKEEKDKGGIFKEMDYIQFMELSFGEIFSRVNSVLAKRYEQDGYCMIEDIFDSKVVFNLYYSRTADKKLLSVDYSLDENGEVILGEKAIEVVRNYVPLEKTEDKPENYSEENLKKDEDSKCAEEDLKKDEDSKCSEEELKKEDNSKCTEENLKKDEDSKCEEENLKKDEDENSKCEEENLKKDDESKCSSNNQANYSVEGKIEENDKQIDNKEALNFAALSASERAEFESLKKEKKVNLLNSYKEVLSDNEFSEFESKINDFSYDELELELLRKYRKATINKTSTNRAFAYEPILNHNNNSDRDPIAEYIKKSKNNR